MASSPTALMAPPLRDRLLKCNSSLVLYGALAGTVAVSPPRRMAPLARAVGLWNTIVACAALPEPEVVTLNVAPVRAGLTVPPVMVSRLALYWRTNVPSVTPAPLLRAIGMPLVELLGTLMAWVLSGPRAKSGTVTATADRAPTVNVVT